MAQISNAIYAGGVLKPNGPLDLRENQRVRVIIEPIDEQPVDRSVALTRLRRESPQCTLLLRRARALTTRTARSLLIRTLASGTCEQSDRERQCRPPGRPR